MFNEYNLLISRHFELEYLHPHFVLNIRKEKLFPKSDYLLTDHEMAAIKFSFFYHNFFQSVLKWSRIITKCYLFCNYFGTCDLWSYNVQFKGRILAHMRIVQEIKKNKRSTCIKFHIICLSLLRTISCIRKYRRLSNTNIRVL